MEQMGKDEVQELLETIIKKLAKTNPSAVKVSKRIDELGVLYSVDMDQRDAGLVIGRNGAVIGAVRTIIKSIAAKQKIAANIKLNVPDVPMREKPASSQGHRFQKPRKRGFDEVENQF